MRVAVKVVYVWFKLKENTTKTKLRKMCHQCNINLTKNEWLIKPNMRSTQIIHTKGKQCRCKRNRD